MVKKRKIAKKKKRRKSYSQGYTNKSANSFLRKQLPLWLAPILGATLTVIVYVLFMIIKTQEVIIAPLLFTGGLGLAAGGILWLARRK